MEHLGHLKANVNQNGEKAKNLKKIKFFKGFWVVWGVHLEPFEGHVGLCWRIFWVLGHLGAMLRYDALS